MQLQSIIEKAWEDRQNLGLTTKGEVRDAVNETLSQLDSVKLATPIANATQRVNRTFITKSPSRLAAPDPPRRQEMRRGPLGR